MGEDVEPGWYTDPWGEAPLRRWDGEQWTGMTSGWARGWYTDHDDPRTKRWWDGTQWTGRTRRRADRATWSKLSMIALLGVLVMLAGGIIAWHGPLTDSNYSSNDPASQACSDEVLVGGAAPLWVPWSLLLGLAVWATVVWTRRTRNDGRAFLLVLAGWAAVTVTCPLLVILLGGANCGL